jgi:putative holliday junction resolvase
MIIGVDPGARRFGVAAADPETRLALPVEVIDATHSDPVDRIAELVEERHATAVVVGRPLTLSGEAGLAVEARNEFVASLRARLQIVVLEHDERLTTVAADRALRAAGLDARHQKEMRDAVAASVMLQSWLDSEPHAR